MKLFVLFLLVFVTSAHAQFAPPEVFHHAAKEDANKELLHVECVQFPGRPYRCTMKDYDSAITYTQLADNKEQVSLCVTKGKNKGMCQSTVIDKPSRRERDLHPLKIEPNDPVHWEHMAKVGMMPVVGSVEYTHHMQDLYVAAIEPCTKLSGMKDAVLWLGRVNTRGKLLKTWVSVQSPFVTCFTRGLKEGKQVGKPPAWDNDEARQVGYPVTFTWNPKKVGAVE